MFLATLLSTVESSSSFKEWRKTNPTPYLVHFLKIIESIPSPWIIGYYNEKSDKITSFFIEKEITTSKEEEVFKKEKKIPLLDISSITIDTDNAQELAEKVRKEEYPKEQPIKTIIILQCLDTAVWNITFITASFNTLNIKINAESGEITSKELTSLMGFRAK